MTVSRDTRISAMPAAGWATLPETSETRYPEVRAVSQGLTFQDRIPLAAARFGATAQIIDSKMASWHGSRVTAGLRCQSRLRQSARQNWKSQSPQCGGLGQVRNFDQAMITVSNSALC